MRNAEKICGMSVCASVCTCVGVCVCTHLYVAFMWEEQGGLPVGRLSS